MKGRPNTLSAATVLNNCLPEPNTGCWLWLGPFMYQGYGVTKIGGRQWRAHRLSYTTMVGPIPDGMHVCHACDVRECVNPEHLWLGTNADNTTDRHLKGRSRGGHRGRTGTKWSAVERESRMSRG